MPWIISGPSPSLTTVFENRRTLCMTPSVPVTETSVRSSIRSRGGSVWRSGYCAVSTAADALAAGASSASANSTTRTQDRIKRHSIPRDGRRMGVRQHYVLVQTSRHLRRTSVRGPLSDREQAHAPGERAADVEHERAGVAEVEQAELGHAAVRARQAPCLGGPAAQR